MHGGGWHKVWHVARDMVVMQAVVRGEVSISLARQCPLLGAEDCLAGDAGRVIRKQLVVGKAVVRAQSMRRGPDVQYIMVGGGYARALPHKVSNCCASIPCNLTQLQLPMLQRYEPHVGRCVCCSSLPAMSRFGNHRPATTLHVHSSAEGRT
jgi:hypothetical protein